MSSELQYGGIEAGGTKFICAIGAGPGRLAAQTRISTTTPDQTLKHVIDFFMPAAGQRSIKSIGIACFGPLDLDRQSPTYGFITSTTKPGWRDTDVVGRLQRELHVPVALDTDVDGAALAESIWGAGHGFDPLLYLTIGTGIGGGLIQGGLPLRGLVHTEMGHIRLPHDLTRDPYAGGCPFHSDCFEGLASGPAILQRFGIRAEDLPDDHPFWETEARYIALAIQDFIVTLSPRKIVLGGGIMQRSFLFGMIRAQVSSLLNGYVRHPMLLDHLDEYILPPLLGSQAGVLGAIALAQSAAPA